MVNYASILRTMLTERRKKEVQILCLYTIARPGRKQTTATEDFDVHVSNL